MFVLSGICAMIALFACLTRYPSKKRKTAQLVMALSTMILLITEILQEYYSGDTTPVGYWMVRICNFLVFLTILLVIHSFTLYLADLIRADLGQPVPKEVQLLKEDQENMQELFSQTAIALVSAIDQDQDYTKRER